MFLHLVTHLLLQRAVQKVQQRLNRGLTVVGYLLTKRSSITMHREIDDLLRQRQPLFAR